MDSMHMSKHIGRGLMVLKLLIGIVLLAQVESSIDPTNPLQPCKGDLMSISELNLIFLDNTGSVLEDLWCYSEMDRYRNPSYLDKGGFGVEEGYVCIEVQKRPSETYTDYAKRVRDDLINRDAQAQKLFNHLGGDYGYLMTGPVARSTPASPSDPNLPFGTGLSALQDAPLNFCPVLMREMICHIAFPQGVGAPKDRMIRPVCYDSCTYMFHLCNRRQPTKEQMMSTYIAPDVLDALQRLSAAGVATPNKDSFGEGFPMKAEYYCTLWNWGLGLAPLTIPTVTPADANQDCIPYSASLVPSLSLLLVFLSLLFVA